MLRAACLFLLFAWFLSPRLPAQAAPATDECRLPPEVQKALAQNWHGWRVLRIADLRAEDQNLWSYARGRVCPGIARGHFYSPSLNPPPEADYALALVRGQVETVVVFPAKHAALVVVPAARLPFFHVVWPAAAGDYQDARGRAVHSTLSALGFEAIGSSAQLFVCQNGRFIPVRKPG